METRVKEGRTALAITILLVVTLTVPAILLGNPASNAQQAQQPSPSGTGPAIQLLNPSDYSTFTYANATQTTVQGPQISDKDTSDTDGANDNPNEYHFTAVVTNAPAQPYVEFWIVQGGAETFLGCAGFPAQGTCRGTFGDNGAVGLVRDLPNDLTEGPPSATDGPTATPGRATVRAILFSNNGQNEAARDNQDVVVNQKERDDNPQTPEQDADPEKVAETLEILYPVHGKGFGLYRRTSGAPVGIVDVEWSSDTNGIRVFYTVSPTDTDPAWKQCGEETTGTPTDAATATDGVRCTLVDGDQPETVTGVAAVTIDNEGTVAAPNSGDAHRVVGYSQVPGIVSVTPATVAASGVDGCTPLLTAQVVDDTSDARQIAGINVDVHAQGPNDNLAFNTHAAEQSAFDQSKPDQSKAPDNHPTQNGRQCSNDNRSGDQGVHAVGGGDDRKHIESVANTDDDGEFQFRLWSDAEGGTRVTAWADTTDDDRYCSNEKAGDAIVTWGNATADPAPPAEGPEPQPCPNPSPSSPSSGGSSSTGGGSTSPTSGSSTSASPTRSASTTPSTTSPSRSATTTQSATGTATSTSTGTATGGTGTGGETGGGNTGTTPQRAEREINLEASSARKTFGTSFTLSGSVTSSNTACTTGASVRILRDVLGGDSDFELFAQETTSANGTFSVNLDADKSANYVAQVAETEGCSEASSSPQPVLVKVKVSLRTSDGRVRKGQRVRLTIRTAPCPETARDKVLLFRSVEGQFGKSGKKRSNDACKATFTRRIRKSVVFQARWPKQAPEYLAGKSRSKAVRVTK